MKNLLIILSALIFTTDSFSQVEWNTLVISTTENLQEITFVNDTVGFVCGEKGILFKTSDAGINWQAIITPDTFTINSVAFIDEMNGGILYGNNNPKFYVTEDGGSSWVQKGFGGGGFCFPHVIYALEDKIIIGGNGCFYGDAIAIYQNDSIVMDTMLGTVNRITNFDFIDDNIGFASSTLSTAFIAFSRIYKTMDGGFSWTLVPNTDSLLTMYDIAFEDENIGYCVSLDTTIYGSETPAVLFKTLDGGNSWNEVLGQLFVTPTFTDVEVYAKDSLIAVGSYVNQFSDNGTVWLNFSDTFPQWFSEDFLVDPLNPRLKKNDVLENNGCLYVIGDKGFISKTGKDSTFTTINSLAQLARNTGFNLFPNPSRGKFSIQFNEVKKAPFNIIVFDIIGNKRFQKDIKLHNLENSFQLDLSFLDK
jgi:photosystem II stability/assembly factor-like uncharacterized protein